MLSSVIFIFLPKKIKGLHPGHYIEEPFYHFSFLKDIKVYGVYYSSFAKYLESYPFIRNGHKHDFYSILFFTGGKGNLRVNNISYKINPNTVCLIAPNQSHSFNELANAEGEILFICQDYYVEEFSYIRLLNVFSCTSQLPGNFCNPCIHVSDKDVKAISDLIKSVSSEYESYSPSNNAVTILRSLINILLLRLSDINGKLSNEAGKGSTILIHELSQLIDSSFIKEHHIVFYTSAFNISEKQMNDICNRYFNCGLKKILKDRLMQEARKLLISTELSVSEISYNLNYDDNSYFNKVFSKETGLTPKKFRDIHRRLIP
jgi:AraC family transcriptional regulator, transcriptional activator of pobA